MKTIRDIRLHLGLSQREFAKRIGASIRSVIYWEQGIVMPDTAHRMLIRGLMRTHGLTKRSRPAIPIREYDEGKMRKYLGSPSDASLDWRHMTLRERNAWWAQRGRYRKLQTDIAAGRVLACPVATK